jgi:hypothetical protein
VASSSAIPAAIEADNHQSERYDTKVTVRK